MSWEWDRGTTSRDPFSWGNKDGAQEFGQLVDYAETREKEDAEMDRLRSDPAVLAMVSKRVKKSIGRTAEMPLMCGTTKTGRYLAFGVVGGKAELVMVFEHTPMFSEDEPTRLQSRLTGEQTSNVPMQFTCLCDAAPPTPPSPGVKSTPAAGIARMALAAKRQGSRRTRLWLYKAALAAMAGDTRKRPFVQLHT